MVESSAPRRRFPRIPSSLTILVRKLGVNEVEGFVKTRVMGLGGCMFACDEAMGVDSYIDLLISLKHEVINARGRVVYELAAETEFEIGIEFVQITEENRKRLQELFEPETPEGEVGSSAG